jgi:hypothetical protein
VGSAVFPAPSSSVDLSSVSTVGQSFTIPSSTAPKGVTGLSLTPGTWRFSCTSGTVCTINLFDASRTAITSGSTSSGVLDIVIASGTTATQLTASINTGTDVVVTITKLGVTLNTATSGSLQTITSTTNLSSTGLAYVVVVGGGNGGGNFAPGGFGRGGNSAGVSSGVIALNGSTTVTIGAGGGTTSVGGITSSPGSTGFGAGSVWDFGSRGSGALASNSSPYTFLVSGTTGGGGNCSDSPGKTIGAGSGIGTGGTGVGTSQTNAAASAGTGYGSGGGGASYGPAGAGAPGVVYLLNVTP